MKADQVNVILPAHEYRKLKKRAERLSFDKFLALFEQWRRRQGELSGCGEIHMCSDGSGVLVDGDKILGGFDNQEEMVELLKGDE